MNLSAAQAERPIVDLHRLDADFQLFASDASVPWKPAAVRLDTYSSAPVAIAVYAVDPADVLTAGANFSPRAIDVGRRRALLSFTFTPPGGYQFQSNRVDLPLGNREGFFVVEARRGDVGEQVWINRSRVGLIAKETPAGFLFYGADLGTGLPLARMRLQFVVNNRFVTELTGNDGIVRWSRGSRPVFVLAQWANSYAFLSILPQPPVPATIVGVRTDSAVVHAGASLHVAGFARTHAGGVLRPGSGSALVTLRSGARTLAERHVEIDQAGAFSTSLTVPENAPAGDYAVLVAADGGDGGVTVHVDANAGTLSLEVGAACSGLCDAKQDVPLRIHTSRPHVKVRVSVVRSPHVYISDTPETATWATTQWFEADVATDDAGNATVRIPRPLDDLGSTYGVRADAGGATADTRVVVPTAGAAVHVNVASAEQSSNSPLTFAVDAELLDGKPLAGAAVTVTLMHGSSAQQQRLTLDSDGRASGSFSAPELGTNLIFATVEHDGEATDAEQVQIDPQGLSPSGEGESADVQIALNAASYRAGEPIALEAQAPGAQGAALLTFESAHGVQYDVVRLNGDRASAHFRALDAPGQLRAGAAFVHDGALEWNTVPVSLVAAGRPHLAALEFGSARLSAGEVTRIALGGAGETRGTYIVRISRGTPSGSAVFSSAPALLAIGLTTTQSSAPDSATWHPWVDSTGNHPEVLDFVRRSQPPPDASLAEAETETLAWKVARGGAEGVSVVLPPTGGRYMISVLAISDDGSVSAASTQVEVR